MASSLLFITENRLVKSLDHQVFLDWGPSYRDIKRGRPLLRRMRAIYSGTSIRSKPIKMEHSKRKLPFLWENRRGKGLDGGRALCGDTSVVFS